MHILFILLIILLVLLLLWVLLTAPRPKSRRPDLTPLRGRFYAHRGYYAKDQSIPENSLPAFARAAEEGFGTELDVHLTKDGRLAVLHDENLKRMCGMDTTLSELDSSALANCRLHGTENTVPLFADVLKVIGGRIPMVIEVKPYGGNIGSICERLCKELEGYGGVWCMESFDPRALLWFKKHRPEVVRGQLAMKPSRYKGSASPVSAFAAGNLLFNWKARPDFVAYCVEDRSNASFRLCKRLFGIQEFSWTIHTPEQIAEVSKTGGLCIFEHFDPRK